MTHKMREQLLPAAAACNLHSVVLHASESLRKIQLRCMTLHTEILQRRWLTAVAAEQRCCHWPHH